MMEEKQIDLGVVARMRPIIDGVLKLYGFSRETLLEGTTRGPIEARSSCCWLARQLELPITFDEIAASLSWVERRRGRTMVQQGLARIRERRPKDKWLREGLDALLTELR